MKNHKKFYGWQELGMIYSPELVPECAGRRLKRWVLEHKELVRELKKHRWNTKQRIMTPRQVALIIKYLDEP